MNELAIIGFSLQLTLQLLKKESNYGYKKIDPFSITKQKKKSICVHTC